MSAAEPEELRRAVERMHDCSAVLADTVHVREGGAEVPAWEGDVYVFELEGHPEADRAYAWAASVFGAERPRFYALLHQDPVDSPGKAVRAALVQDRRRD